MSVLVEITDYSELPYIIYVINFNSIAVFNLKYFELDCV